VKEWVRGGSRGGRGEGLAGGEDGGLGKVGGNWGGGKRERWRGGQYEGVGGG